ncbi:MAG: hypoxanthine phosphoribosyltransferase, partial [Chlorobiales bacterium]|nr:hypoxanthine phosphoribosyltransferase [Chlorobiales bacterium]
RQTSSGKVAITHDIDIGKRHVLLVEDIVDTGLTISGIIAELRNLDPLSLRVCTLLDKPSERRVMVSPDYTGFTIPAYFVVGYGLDIAGKFRELPYIGVYRP